MTATGELCVFAGVMALGQFSPGPDMLLLTRTSLRDGVGVGLKMALGIVCGLTVHATIAVCGVAVAFERIPLLRWTLQWVAAIYLLWLACGLLRVAFVAWYSGVRLEIRIKESGRPPFARGLLCNLFNPKVAMLLAAVSAPFLAGNHPDWWPVAVWMVIVGLGLGLWSLWVVLLQWPPLRSRYESAAHWIDGFFGAALVVLAVRLMIG
jgi:threonine efflux protein